jgi:hypothetical protein
MTSEEMQSQPEILERQNAMGPIDLLTDEPLTTEQMDDEGMMAGRDIIQISREMESELLALSGAMNTYKTPESIREANRRYRLAHPEKVRAGRPDKETAKAYRSANLEKIRTNQQEYYKRNRETILKKQSLRHAIKTLVQSDQELDDEFCKKCLARGVDPVALRDRYLASKNENLASRREEERTQLPGVPDIVCPTGDMLVDTKLADRRSPSTETVPLSPHDPFLVSTNDASDGTSGCSPVEASKPIPIPTPVSS